MTPIPSIPAPDSAGEAPQWVQVALDLETGGHFLVYHLRVDGTNLEPSAGGCRRWWMQRVAREAGPAPRAFCGDDDVWFDVAVGRHTLALQVASEHTVAKRVVLRPGANVRWRMPIRTGPIEIPLDVEPGQSYTVEGREVGMDLRRALPAERPSGTDWDLDAYEKVFRRGVEVGSLRIRIVRDADGREVGAVSVPLLSGRMACQPPFCS